MHERLYDLHIAIPHMHRKSDQAEGIVIDHTVRDGARSCDLRPIFFPANVASEMNYSFFRAELQRVLLEHLLPKNKVRLNKRLVSYVQLPQSHGLELLFEDGSTAVCDVLLGCDGIRSKVRATMYSKLADDAQADGKSDEAEKLRSHITPVFSGEVVYRCLVRKDSLPEGIAEHRAFDSSDLIIVSLWNDLSAEAY